MSTTTLATASTPMSGDHEQRPFRLLRHSLALAKRSLIKTARTPESLADVTIQPVIFLGLFDVIFGGAVAGSQQAYLQFLLPGILAQTIALGCIGIGVGLNRDIEKGVFDRFRSLPIARLAPLLGIVLADVVRYAIVTMVTLSFGLLIGFRFGTNPLAVLAGCVIAIAFALCLCWVSVWVGLLVRTPGAVQGVLIPVMLPLSFGSNVFVPTDKLPGWMQTFVHVNPLTQLIATTRGLFVGGPVAGPLFWTAVWMVTFVVVFMPLALRAYSRKT